MLRLNFFGFIAVVAIATASIQRTRRISPSDNVAFGGAANDQGSQPAVLSSLHTQGTFVDENAGFSVSYDTNWKTVTPKTRITSLELVPMDNETGARMSITAISSFYQTPAKFVKEELASRKDKIGTEGSPTSKGKLLEVGTATVSGYEAFFEKSKYPDNMISYAVHVHYRSRRYMLLLRVAEAKFDESFVAFMKLRDTFTIKP